MKNSSLIFAFFLSPLLSLSQSYIYNNINDNDTSVIELINEKDTMINNAQFQKVNLIISENRNFPSVFYLRTSDNQVVLRSPIGDSLVIFNSNFIDTLLRQNSIRLAKRSFLPFCNTIYRIKVDINFGNTYYHVYYNPNPSFSDDGFISQLFFDNALNIIAIAYYNNGWKSKLYVLREYLNKDEIFEEFY
jgi:hypothetical protein